jgi:hypothetical protein
MIETRRSILRALVGIAALAAPSTAFAGSPAAEALFDQGRQSMERNDYEQACKQFQESNKLEPAVGTEFNLADCEEKRGRLATAWQLFRAVEQKLPAGDDRAPIAHGRAQALEPRLPKVTLVLAAGAPNDTTVRDGSVELGSGSFGTPLPFDPGAHDLVASAPGHASRTFHVQLAEGETKSVPVEPGASSGTSASTADTSGAHAGAGGSNTRTLGFVLGGVGVAGIGVGAVAGLMVLGKKNTAEDECPANQCSPAGYDAVESGRTLKTVSNIGWIVGALGVGAGAYFILTSSNGESTTAVGPVPLPAGGGLAMRRTW